MKTPQLAGPQGTESLPGRWILVNMSKSNSRSETVPADVVHYCGKTQWDHCVGTWGEGNLKSFIHLAPGAACWTWSSGGRYKLVVVLLHSGNEKLISHSQPFSIFTSKNILVSATLTGGRPVFLYLAQQLLTQLGRGGQQTKQTLESQWGGPESSAGLNFQTDTQATEIPATSINHLI